MRSTFLYFCFGWFSLTVPQKLVQGYFWETELKMNCKSAQEVLSSCQPSFYWHRTVGLAVFQSRQHHCIQAVMLNVTFVIFLNDKLQMVLFFFSVVGETWWRWSKLFFAHTLAAFVTVVFGWADVSMVLQAVEQLVFNVTIMCVF